MFAPGEKHIKSKSFFTFASHSWLLTICFSDNIDHYRSSIKLISIFQFQILVNNRMKSDIWIFAVLFMICMSIVHILQSIEKFTEAGTCAFPTNPVLPTYTQNVVLLKQCEDTASGAKLFVSETINAYFPSGSVNLVLSSNNVPEAPSYYGKTVYYTFENNGEEKEVSQLLEEDVLIPLTRAQVKSSAVIELGLPTNKIISQIAVRIRLGSLVGTGGGNTASGNTDTGTGAGTGGGNTASGNTDTGAGTGGGNTASGNTDTGAGTGGGNTASGNTDTGAGTGGGNTASGNTDTGAGTATGEACGPDNPDHIFLLGSCGLDGKSPDLTNWYLVAEPYPEDQNYVKMVVTKKPGVVSNSFLPENSKPGIIFNKLMFYVRPCYFPHLVAGFTANILDPASPKAVAQIRQLDTTKLPFKKGNFEYEILLYRNRPLGRQADDPKNVEHYAVDIMNKDGFKLGDFFLVNKAIAKMYMIHDGQRKMKYAFYDTKGSGSHQWCPVFDIAI
jgi:hypothetical protein